MNLPVLTIVVPCFNEEEVLPFTAVELCGLLDRLRSQGKIAEQSGIHFVDDGSRDATWRLIEELSAADHRIHGIKLSRNYGHQNAILAGIFQAEGDMVITIDADLQDDVAVMSDMVDAHLSGAQIVYGVRRQRTADTWLKRVSAELYYRLLSALGVAVVFNHADYRLMSRRAVEALREHREVNLFLRGIIPTIGLASATVTYARAERVAGVSKYRLRKMLGLAVDGVTSFSVVPLRFIAGLGFLMFLLSSGLSIWVILIRMFTQRAVPGWASVTLPMYLLGGIQLLSTGVVGEYIGKIYMETKRRPRYLIDKCTNNGANSMEGEGRGRAVQW